VEGADHVTEDSAAPQTVSAMIGLVVDAASGSEVLGHIEVDEQHHQGSGIVHGGVYAHVIESVATIGASAAVRELGQGAVGVNNQTDFLRPFSRGRLDIVGRPIQQGRTLQLWLVEISNGDGKMVARGQVRLFNQARNRAG
jgi:1,4-dihydroxy-2-naphthoyl-CoA hydrolase